MACIEPVHNFFMGKCIGLRVDPLAALFNHNIAFGFKIFFAQGEIDHPVRFQRHDICKALFRDTLKINRQVGHGHGIILPAHGCDDF